MHAAPNFFALILVGLTPANVAWSNEQLLSQIAETARTTQARLQTETASWKCRNEIGDKGVVFEFDVVQSPSSRETKMRLLIGERLALTTSIIDYEGLWFVNDNGTRYSCRPYEAPLQLPALYTFLSQSDLLYLTEAYASKLGELRDLGNGKALITGPLDDHVKELTKTAIKGFEQVIEIGKPEERLKAQEQLANLKERLQRGVRTEIDLQRGIVLESDTFDRRIAFSDFLFLGEKQFPDPRIGQQWESRLDRLYDPSRDNQGLIILGHAGAWRPGAEGMDTDSVLLDINSGKLQRVPYVGGISSTGCLSPDRSKAYVAGQSSLDRILGPVEVDLQSGINRRLDKNLPRGLYMFPRVSPDGKYLAVLQMGEGQDQQLPMSQIYLIKLSTEEATAIGPHLDCAFLTWLPDRNGLMFLRRERTPAGLVEVSQICTLDLTGMIHPIMEGEFPICLRKSHRILFKDSDGKWKTADLQGEDVKTIGDGLKGFGFPTVSPDEGRIVMMKFSDTTGPRPYVVDLETGKADEISVPPGLWVMPTWR